jgi:hypothetical protein
LYEFSSECAMYCAMARAQHQPKQFFVISERSTSKET